MGEIAKRRIERTAHAVLLVGQAPGADGDLRPLTGTMGVRLADLAGLVIAKPEDETVRQMMLHAEREDLIGLFFDRANVLDFFPGKQGKGHAFPIGHARVAAHAMWPRLLEYDRVLFCGRQVYDVFRTCQYDGVNLRKKEWRWLEPYRWHGHRERDGRTMEFAHMHHVSMVVPWWNDLANVDQARRFLTALADWTIWGREEEAA